MDPAEESFDYHFPQSWNRYSYVRSNPLVAIDPDGEVLEIKVQNTLLRQQIESSLEKIEGGSPRIKTMVEGLRNSKNVHTILEVSGDMSYNEPLMQDNADNGKGTGSSTKIPTSGVVIDIWSGDVLTLDQVLEHELSHAEDADTGTRSDREPCRGCAPEKEAKAIRMQNLVRPGTPRGMFGNKRVPSPRKTPADPRKRGQSTTGRKK